MLSADDPYSGIDFDDCFFDGNVDPGIKAEILAIDSYTEVSPSGNGFKSLVKGKLPGPGHHNENIGVFDNTRYFCITGKRLKSVSHDIEERQDALDTFYAKHWGKVDPPVKPLIDDSDIIQKAIYANDGGKFSSLWYGNTNEYSSSSEADLALCSKLAFWVNSSPALIDYHFRNSGLMRDKWNRDDYRASTIRRACETQMEGYSGTQYTEFEGQSRTESDRIGLDGQESAPNRTGIGKQSDSYRSKSDNYRTTVGLSGPTQMNLKSALKAWILLDKRTFRIQDVYNDLDIRNPKQKKTVSTYLSKFCDEGLIERGIGQRGVFLYKESECTHIDFLSVEENTDSVICLPLGLEALGIHVMPGNIIVVAGESNAGKTSILLNIAHDNLSSLCSTGKYATLKYFSSEMGPQEMHTRIKAFGGDMQKWKGMQAIERTNNFHQVIDPDGLNIIDFMEVHNEFYLVGEWIRRIHETLNDGVCVIALQKKSGSDFGRSGEISLEKPRLYLSISEVIKGYSSCKIVKAKNYIAERNPNGLEKDFRVTGRGAVLDELTDWRYVQYAERKRINKEYELLVKQEYAEYAERSIPGDEYAYKFYVDGDMKPVTFRQVQQWRDSYKGLDVDVVLEQLAADSMDKPFLTKNWFFQVSGLLGKK
ncbi:MAG: hypothetical protein HOK67_24765, partial [Deltaproteobacteria bacterium]|nr:hypothetical protein [Deltaproteobacteria bacterium]